MGMNRLNSQVLSEEVNTLFDLTSHGDDWKELFMG